MACSVTYVNSRVLGPSDLTVLYTLKGGVMSRSIFRFCMQLVELTFSFPKLCPILKSGVKNTNYGAWKLKIRGADEN